MEQDRFLAGRCAWITGASRGLGRSLAVAFARAGAHAILGARDSEGCARTVEAIVGQGLAASALPLDVCDERSVADFVESATARFGPPSVLVNNAATATFRNFENLSTEEFDAMYATNVRGPWLLAKLALPQLLRAQDPAIVNISSLAGSTAAPMGAGYCGSKAALDMLSEVQFVELRKRGVRVLLVKPGSIDTRFHVDSHPGMHRRDQSWMLAPEEVARTVVGALRPPQQALVSRIEIRPLTVPPRESEP